MIYFVFTSFIKGFFFLVILLLCCKSVVGDIKITNENKFIEFVNNVNSGTDYSGTTVLLDSDLSLSGKTLEPIGNDTSNYFNGTFDGQGHIISDLKMNSSTSQYAGLFGCSYGLTIRNVVLDSSCSITSSYNGSDYVYIGGFIGYCYARSGECSIENSVNMADVTFSGDISEYGYELCFGGLVGRLAPPKYLVYMKNCANYGSVTHSGISSYSFIGGIIGYLGGSNSAYKYLYNSLNYGTITHSGTTSSNLHIGGIAGSSSYTYIENWVSAGKVSTQNVPSASYIGSIMGGVGSYTFINYCYYASDLSDYEMYGYGTPKSSSNVLSYDNTTFELNESVSVGSYTGTSLINALNAYPNYYFLRDHSKWLLNEEEKSVNFTINDRSNPVAMDYQVILLLSLASEGSLWFDGWYTDNGYTNLLESFEINEDKTLYGRLKENTNNYTIIFDTRREGSSVAPITAQFGDVVSLPNDTIREHCSVAWWENEYGDKARESSLTVPARNFILYAVWLRTHITTPNDFTGFSNIVNSGTSGYSGITVFLDSDLSLSEETFEPIGNDDSNYFHGVFDGQGHTISDLKVNSSSYYAGLFGYSAGTAIKNVVLDSSCSITSSYRGSNSVYTGGIIGRCGEKCNIENSVNMADVTFSGTIGNYYYLYLGGIAGYLSYSSYMKNCANHGSVTHSGTSGYSRIGGIVGYLEGSKYKYLYNCLNYGTITHSGTTSWYLYLGGISGYAASAYIENCVSAGEISTQNTPSEDSRIGSIAGYVDSNTYINYCYYTSDLSEYEMYGYAYSAPSVSYTLSYDNTTFELNGAVSIGNYTENSLIDALNAAADYYFLCDYSKWLFNKEEKSMTFTINSRTSPITMNSQVILIPSLGSEGSLWFDGWYNDNMYTDFLESFEINEDKTLYGRFEENTNKYTVTFDTRREGVSVAPITAQFGSNVSLPSEFIREYCSVAFWETEHGYNVELSLTMPAHNFTLYAVWKCTHIATPEDFIDFSKVVNSGTTNFSGTTVLLDSDLSLSDKTLESIGKDYSYHTTYHFRGVFYGQGHIISNLKMNSSSQCAGLFGYSDGLTIKNVVLDSSCSITNAFTGNANVRVGGIIGGCCADNGECNIENSVNMADVTFNGNTTGASGFLFIGGIAGYFSSSSYSAYVKNCANYGSVTHSGTSSNSYIGGIAGESYSHGSSALYNYIQNSLNYGTTTHIGTTPRSLYIGGIVGYGSPYTCIENCVSAGKISTSYSYIGSIVGYVSFSYTYVNYCYYTSDVNANKINGAGKFNSTTGTPDTPTDVDSELVGKLNSNATSCNWNKWLMLHLNGGSIVNLTQDPLIGTQGQIPSPAKEGNSFLFWCEDAKCVNEFDPKTDSVSEITELYAAWVNSIVTFDFDNGTTVNATFTYNTEITYPDVKKKEGYTLSWDNYHELMPAGDITVTAQWTPNNYTVTFDTNDEDASETSKIVTFNEKYGKLPESNKIGHTFSGWFTDENVEITDETIVNIASNHILHARYTPNNYSVKFVCGNKTIYKHLMTYNTSIEYKGENPTKAFHKFDGWCIENGEDCLPKRVPAGNITFYAYFTIDAAAVSGTAVGSFVGAILLVFLIIVLVVVILILKKGMKIGHEAVDVEMSQTNATERNKENDMRIIKHMVAMSISNGTVNKLGKRSKPKKKDRVLNEVFDDLGVDYNDNSYGISESFKMMGVVDTIVNSLQNNTNLAAVGSYLSLLFAAVRDQEDFEAFEKLYFGMKDVNKFIHAKKDEGTIRFEGIVTGFTDKLMVIRLLSEGEEDNLPRGVLFKVQNGKGYNVESQGEVLFELNSAFLIEKMEEVIRDRYIVVKLSYTSSSSEDEMVSI